MRICFLLSVLVFWSVGLLGQNVDIPDENFMDALIGLGVDTDDDSIISVSEAELVYFLDVSGKDILDFKGIEAFVNLDTLYCQMNGISDLNISACTKLKHLNCAYNNLSALDLSSNVQMLSLDCHNNQMGIINVTQCENMQSLKCYLNNLTSLDVSGNANLSILECYNNSIVELDLTSNIFLEELACVSNQLSSLDLSKNLLLNDLNCADNDLSILEISNNSSIQFMHCESNNLAELDLSGCSSLIGLECQGNQLSSLDISNNLAMNYLDCQNNLLSHLDVSNNRMLLFLGCGGNQLEELDFSSNIALKTIDCSNNQLTELDLTYNTVLTELRCYNNQLDCLDISNQTLIERMDASNNQLVTIDLSNFKGCDWFTCISLQNMPSLLQVCLSDLNWSYLISINGSPNVIFSIECEDIYAPELIVEELVEDQESVMIISNENGMVYLVPEDTEKDLELIRESVLDSIVVSANMQVSMSVLAYPNGVYWFYARDTSNNLSEQSIMTIQWVGVENELLEQIRVFPNPVTDQLWVILAESIPISIEIISLNGRSVYFENTGQPNYFIDFSGFKSGVYFMKISSGEGLFIRKLIKL